MVVSCWFSVWNKISGGSRCFTPLKKIVTFLLTVWSCLMLMLVCILWLDAVVFKPEPNPTYSSRLKDCNLVRPQRLNHWSLTIGSVYLLQYKAHLQWKNCLDSQPGALKIIALCVLCHRLEMPGCYFDRCPHSGWAIWGSFLSKSLSFHDPMVYYAGATCHMCVGHFKSWLIFINSASGTASVYFYLFFFFF